MPNAGELRQRVRFERRVPAEDGYGNAEGEFATLIRRRHAKLAPTKGSEQLIAARAQGTSQWDLWVRFDSATSQITPDDRVVDLDDERRVFNIKFVGDLTGDRTWLLMQLELGGAS